MAKDKPAPQEALDAWKVANFSLVTLDPDDPFITVTDKEHHGREGLLEKRLFIPRQYNFRQGDYSTMWDLRGKWQGTHLEAVNRVHVGPNAQRIATIVVTELMFHAARAHGASTVWAASRIQMEPATQRVTELSLWDDGINPYSTPEELEEAYRGPDIQPSEHMVSKAAVEIAHTFRGTLSVLTGKTRTDVTAGSEGLDLAFVHSATEGIEGNLVIASFPHLSSSRASVA